MSSLYDELGVSPSASEDELRTAFRQRARRLHPDVNVDPEASAAMIRLNEVWAILGDPEARRRYDEEQREPVAATFSPPSPPPVSVPEPFQESSAFLYLLVRPWVIIPAILLLIVVVTAYAGHSGGGGRPATTTTTAAPSASAFVGQCLQPQGETVVVVPCSDRPNSLVIAVVPTSSACPVGATSYQLAGQADLLCASPSPS